MTHEPQPWLPPAAPGEVESALRDAATVWLARWVVDAPCRDTPDVTSDEGGEHRPAGATATDLATLGAAACANRADPLNPRDREALERVGRAMLNDLVADIAGRAGSTEHGEHGCDAAPHAAYVLASSALGWSIGIKISAAQQIALRRRASYPARSMRLGSLQAALKDELVEVGCHLGRASLTAAEVAALGVGDLIVLDRQLRNALPLTVAGSVCARGTACVERTDECFAIRIESELDLTRN